MVIEIHSKQRCNHNDENNEKGCLPEIEGQFEYAAEQLEQQREKGGSKRRDKDEAQNYKNNQMHI
jgi:hypothetical protein